MPGGAYHLVSDLPVTVWQFNPLTYAKPDMVSASNKIGGLVEPYNSAKAECRDSQ